MTMPIYFWFTTFFCYREKLQQFFWSVKQRDGSFVMHQNGEVDVRGAYCALSVAKLVNIYTPELFEGTAEWIVRQVQHFLSREIEWDVDVKTPHAVCRCQSYEGGFSACPGMEAHGGYSFCAIATLCMLGKDHLCDINAFMVTIQSIYFPDLGPLKSFQYMPPYLFTEMAC